ncbi:MAG TPA: LD-carboxypeptidase [Candidatus Angelobacter sp.]|nr:LD-carboxypeptidase [Candidatus Angelobacter sp.]
MSTKNHSASPAPALKARAIRAGDKIGIVAPASNVRRELLEAGSSGLRKIGYESVYSPEIFERDLYFAGSAERRVLELEAMMERADVAAVICARGGYGSNYLLERLDFEKLERHPKVLMGYSDNTSLLTAIHDRTGLITFHGPMVTKDLAAEDGVEATSWNNALQGTNEWTIPMDGVEVLRPGRARGKLYGGCLSILVASLGTPFEIQTEDTVLFLEDIGTKPYQIDRMLVQMRLAGKLERVRGIVFGEMADCRQPAGQDYTLQEVVVRVLKDIKGPIVYGLKSGHVSSRNITLPIGVQAELSADGAGARLAILEAATV